MSLPPTSRFYHGDETDPFDKQDQPSPRRNAPAWIILGSAVVLLVVVIGVVIASGGGDDTPAVPAAASTVTVERTVAPTTTTPSSSSVAPRPTASAADGAGVMPDVVCMNLQAAQDRIQKTGVFYSRSEDATGKGRAQLFDRNWIVVSQSPAPGSRIGEGDAVLSVVKTDEPNDC